MPEGAITIPANADLSSYKNYLIKINSSGKAALAGDGWRVDGILLNKPAAANRAAVIETRSGVICHVLAGAAITAGAELASDASGLAVTALSSDEVFGLALEDASGSGSLIKCLTRFKGGLTG